MKLCFLTIAAAVLLTACAGQPIRQALPPAQAAAAEAQQVAREAALQGAPVWSLQGRIAVSNAGKGGSGRIEWAQDAAHYDVLLSAPVTRQSWRLMGDARAAQLEGLGGGTREAADPAVLLRDATGWDIPVVALSAWVRGARAPVAAEAARVQYGFDGRLLQLQQGGWTIDYHWPPAGSGAVVAGQILPIRLDARRGEASVRLIVDQWGRGAP